MRASFTLVQTSKFLPGIAGRLFVSAIEASMTGPSSLSKFNVAAHECSRTLSQQGCALRNDKCALSAEILKSEVKTHPFGLVYEPAKHNLGIKGLWERVPIEKRATPTAFLKNLISVNNRLHLHKYSSVERET